MAIILTDYVEMPLNRPTTGNSAGFDFGLKRYLTGSDANNYDSPQFFKRSLNAIKRANRNHSRKVKGSNNRERARLNVARKHRRIANQRANFHWQLAHELTDRYDWISLETLNMKGMKSLWGRKVSDLGTSCRNSSIFTLRNRIVKSDSLISGIHQAEPATSAA